MTFLKKTFLFINSNRLSIKVIKHVKNQIYVTLILFCSYLCDLGFNLINYL